jgi:MarR family transcriptional regulator, organic hydroperoxide resistance regulator
MRAAEQFRYGVLAAQREGNRQLAAALEPVGLTPAQSEVLRILGENAPMTLSAVGSMLVCESGTNPSRLVDKLVAAGLVERSPGRVDRRQVLLTLTPSGERAEAAVREIEEGVYEYLDAALGEQLDALTTTLRRIVADSPAGAALTTRIAARR